jgi:hypothetical protein
MRRLLLLGVIVSAAATADPISFCNVCDGVDFKRAKINGVTTDDIEIWCLNKATPRVTTIADCEKARVTTDNAEHYTLYCQFKSFTLSTPGATPP